MNEIPKDFYETGPNIRWIVSGPDKETQDRAIDRLETKLLEKLSNGFYSLDIIAGNEFPSKITLDITANETAELNYKEELEQLKKSKEKFGWWMPHEEDRAIYLKWQIRIQELDREEEKVFIDSVGNGEMAWTDWVEMVESEEKTTYKDSVELSLLKERIRKRMNFKKISKEISDKINWQPLTV